MHSRMDKDIPSLELFKPIAAWVHISSTLNYSWIVVLLVHLDFSLITNLNVDWIQIFMDVLFHDLLFPPWMWQTCVGDWKKKNDHVGCLVDEPCHQTTLSFKLLCDFPVNEMSWPSFLCSMAVIACYSIAIWIEWMASVAWLPFLLVLSPSALSGWPLSYTSTFCTEV